MSECCDKHPHEIGVALCRRCGAAWCSACLVYAFGPKKPPYCMSCAMVAGGVRTAARPAMSRKMVKAKAKAAKAEAKAAAKAPTPPPPVEPELRPAAVSAASPTDWSNPWSDDR